MQYLDDFQAEREAELVEMAIREKLNMGSFKLDNSHVLSELVKAYKQYPSDSREVKDAEEELYNTMSALYWLSMKH